MSIDDELQREVAKFLRLLRRLIISFIVLFILSGFLRFVTAG